MNRATPWALGVAVVVLSAGLAYYFWPQHPSVKPQPPPVETAVAPAAVPAVEQEASATHPVPSAGQEESATHYPAPQTEPTAPTPERQASTKSLPELSDSDALAREALAGLIDADLLQKYLVPQALVRHIVATVDNLPRKLLARRLVPVKPVGGEFLTTEKDHELAIAAANSARYASLVSVAEAADAKKLVGAYARLYPLFQKAYEELGYPKGYFNDRLIFVIDHLLAAPESQGPVALVNPHVQFRYADPDLEARSAGQKILLRIGNENAAAIKAKLREIRRELTSQNLKP
jgi:hypothetical protein